MEKAIAYIRVSDIKQIKEGNSLITQEKEVRAYAERCNFDLLKVFIERGESAKTDRRTVLQEMLTYCRTQVGTVDTLIVPKIDRFAREAIDYHLLKRRLKALGIRLESVGERIEDTPVGRFTETVLAAVAQFDNEIRAERSKGGMIQAVTEGRWVTNAPRGYRNVRHEGKATIAPNPKDAPIIIEMFERLASKRYRPKEVHTWLHSKGITLGRSQFYSMIRNKAYIGVIEMFGLSLPASPPFVPLVSKDIFYEAQKVFRPIKLPKVYQRDNPDFPLRGTLLCVCEQFYTSNWAKGRSQRYGHYRCRNCKRVNYRKELLEAAFAQELSKFCPHPEVVRRMRQYTAYEWQKEQVLAKKQRQRLHQEITSMEELQKAIAIKNAEGVTPDHIAKSQIEELNVKLMEKRGQLKLAQASETEIKDVFEFGIKFLTEVDSFWRDANIVWQKRIQQFFFPRGLVYNPKFGFRTADYPHLTEVKAYMSGKCSAVVDHTVESPNRLLEFLKEIHRLFSEDFEERKEQAA